MTPAEIGQRKAKTSTAALSVLRVTFPSWTVEFVGRPDRPPCGMGSSFKSAEKSARITKGLPHMTLAEFSPEESVNAWAVCGRAKASVKAAQKHRISVLRDGTARLSPRGGRATNQLQYSWRGGIFGCEVASTFRLSRQAHEHRAAEGSLPTNIITSRLRAAPTRCREGSARPSS
jgi:hypothetical protein